MEEQKTIIVSKTERPNSFEVGKAGSRWKLYFNDASDLTKMIADLKLNGFDVWGSEDAESK